MFKWLQESRTVPLDTAGAALASATSVAEVVAALRRSARAIAGADGITVVRRIGDEVAYVDEDAIAPLWTGHRFPLRACISGLAMVQKGVVVVPDIYEDQRVPHHAYLSTFVRSMAMFPIGRDDPQMAMGAYWREARAIAPEVIERMTRLAEAAGAALERIGAGGEDRQVA